MTAIQSHDRLAALHASGLLSAVPGDSYHRAARIAARLTGAPAALVSAVSDRGAYITASVGVPAGVAPAGLPLLDAPCEHVVATCAPFAVADLRTDARWAESRVVREMGGVAYLGVPLRDPDGHVLGSVCVIDAVPRAWTETELAALGDVSALLTSELVSERHRDAADAAARRARAGEQHLRAILDAEPECVKLIAANGRLLDMNPAGLAMIEAADLAVVLGQPVVGLVASADRAAFLELHRQVLAGERGTLEFEIVGLAGTRRRVETHAVPYTDPITGVTLHLGVTRDITALRASEDQLRQAQRMEAVGQLAGGIAHDFNNLLTAILSHAEFALEDLPPESPSREEIGQVRRAAQRAATLTRQLLAFSRRQVLQPRLVSLDAVLTEVAPMLRRLIGEHIHIDIQSGGVTSAVFADAMQLEQVVINLAVNARDAMPGGGILRLAVGEVLLPDAPAVDRRPGLAPGAYVTLSVQDTGVGMDEATRRRAFEPFFTTKAPGEGTGLGLASVYGIVKQSSGYVDLASTPGGGTTVTVMLPRQGLAPAPTVAAGEPPAMASGQRETVLLVEDDEAVRSAVLRVLVRHGYTVLTARHGAEALRLWDERAGPIDLVLTDAVMPGLGGRGLLEELRSRDAGLRALVISGYPTRYDLGDASWPADVRVLPKPFTLDGLLTAVSEALTRAPSGATSRGA